MNPSVWKGMKYPDSEVVGLVHRYARPGVAVPASGARAVDVGCGPGRHTRFLCDIGYDAYGVDNDPEMVATARENGVRAERVNIDEFEPPEPLDLALCWGVLFMLPNGAELVARWRPLLIIADWRSPRNDCFTMPDNRKMQDGGVLMQKAGHTLDGVIYYPHDVDECNFAGYERLYVQTITKRTETETHEWIQTVHRRS